MKFNKDTIIAVLASALTTLMLVTFIGPRQTTVVVRDTPATPRVAVSGMMPGFGSDDPDWWQHASPFMADSVEDEKIYCIKEVVEVHDGDTFDAVLEWDVETENEYVRIRLAGVNCPERFDQNCWLEAKDYTEGFLYDLSDADSGIRTASDLLVRIVAEDDTRGRYVGLVYKRDQEEKSFKETLGYKLLENGYALPCFSYLEKYSLFEYISKYYEVIESTRAAFEWASSNTTKMSVWDAPEDIGGKEGKFYDFIDIEMTPLLSKNSKNKKYAEIVEGDEIKVSINKKNYLEALMKRNMKKEDAAVYSMSGFSIIDESSSADARFFLPTVNLLCNLSDQGDCMQNHYPYLIIHTGVPGNSKQYVWAPGFEANCKPKVYMLKKTNLINDNGDTIFIRNADRRVIAWAYWDGEKFYQADEFQDYIDTLETE